MAVGDRFRVAVNGRLHGQTVIMTFHYIQTVAGVGNPAATLASLVDAGVAGTLLPILSNEYTYLFSSAQKYIPGPPEVARIDSTATGTGGVAESSLPVTNCVVMRKRTLYAGRRYRGRIFVPGIPLSYENDSVLSAAGIAAFNGVKHIITDTLTGGGHSFAPILTHKDTTPETYSDITGVDFDTVLRVQRRREVGKGI